MVTQAPTTDLQTALDRAILQLQAARLPPTVVDPIVASLKAAQMTDRKVFEELSALMDYILNARHEIADIQPDAISGQHIPNATDELDAVVTATEEASNKIMDRCDAINALIAALPPEAQGPLTNEVNSIFEACNFQDLTGQRITKVVRTLKHIETQVASLLRVLEAAGLRPMQETEFKELNVSKASDTEKHLLNGPQLGDAAIKQDDIDKLFG